METLFSLVGVAVCGARRMCSQERCVRARVQVWELSRKQKLMRKGRRRKLTFASGPPVHILCISQHNSHQPFLVGFSDTHFTDEATETQKDQELVTELGLEAGSRTRAPLPSSSSWKLLLGFEEWRILWQEGKDWESLPPLLGSLPVAFLVREFHNPNNHVCLLS